MTSYQQTIPHSSPLRLAPVDRQSLARGLTVMLAALIAAIVLAVSIELTMGYTWTTGPGSPTPQPAAGPVL